MTFRVGLLASFALALVLAGTGCSNKTNAERDSLLTQNEQLKRDLDAERAARAQADNRANSSIATATQPAEVTTPPMEGSVSEVPANGPSARGKKPTSVGSSGSEAVSEIIELPGDILFPSGKAALTAAGKKELDKAATALKSKHAGSLIRVEGYTDPAPVKGSGWDDNYDLGSARANAVRIYLETRGVHNMYIASFGPTHLKSTKNMALNRRVNIVVLKG